VRGFGFCKRSANLPPSLENDSHQLEKNKNKKSMEKNCG
jgi:hypothetical protein